MFLLDRKQQQLLVEVLNYVNRFTFEQWCQTVHASGGKTRAGTFAPWSDKSNQPVILSIGHDGSINQRQLIASVFGLYYHFKDFFRYSFDLELNVQNISTKNEKASRIVKWLARFFKHSLLVNINFDRLFELDDQENGTADKEIRPKTAMTNGTGNGTFNSGGMDVKKEDANMYQQQQQHACYGNDNTNNNNNNNNNNNDGNFQQANNFREDHFSQLTILALLFLHLLYKFRYLFPGTARMLEDFWKYLATIEDSLSKNFLFDNYIHFLCNEIGEQKRRNEERVASLRSELAQMERLNKQLVPSTANINSSMMMTNDNINHHPHQQQQQQQQQFMSPILNDYAHNSNSNTNGGGNYKKNSSSISSNSSHLGMPQTSTSRSNGGGGGKNTAGLACLICHKVFRNSYKLNRHQYVHKDASEKPLACTYENCTYRSISNNDLNRHRMIHTGEKPYLCNINGCEKRYSRPDKLRNHRNSIHFKDPSMAGFGGGSRSAGVKGNNPKSFVCVASGCNFRSSNRSEFNSHALTHVYRCEQFACDRQFDKADKLRRHLERDHGLIGGGSSNSSVSSMGLVATANGGSGGSQSTLSNCNGGGNNGVSNNNFNQMVASNAAGNNNMNSNHVINNNGQGRALNADYATAAAMAAIGSLSSNLAAAGAAAHHQQTATAADLASVISSTIAHNAQLATMGHAGGIGAVSGQANSTTLSMLSVAAAAAGNDQMSVAQFDQLHHQLLAVAAAGGSGGGGIVNNQTGVAAHCNGQSLDVLGLNGHHHQQQQQQQQQQGQQQQQQQRLNQGLSSLWPNADYNTLKERL